MALTQHLGRSGCSLTVKACCATQELKKEAGGARAKEMAELARFKSELRMLEAGDPRFHCLLNGPGYATSGRIDENGGLAPLAPAAVTIQEVAGDLTPAVGITDIRA